jgi:flavodoxin I
MKTSLIYGPKGGSTEKAAKICRKALKLDKEDVRYVKDVDPGFFEAYGLIIFGIPTIGRDTWNQDYKNDGWDVFIANVGEYKLKGKKVAIFGLGNQVLYGDYFVDAIGRLAGKLEAAGAEIIGKVPTDGYDFTASVALRDGMFLGLPIDEDTQAELTEERITNWVAQLKKDAGM